MEIKLPKYPIISKDGNEYLANIYHTDTNCNPRVEVKLYTKRQGKLKLRKFKKVYEISYTYIRSDSLYNKYINNFRQCVIDTVKKYERKMILKEIENSNYKKAIEEFENWDGKCI